jgi:NADH-quinone oxidoreductase B subunit
LNAGGVNVVVGSLDQAINWGRSNSLWSLTFATSCCGIEFMAVGCARYDFARFGFEVTRNSPRQADLIMCAGTITNKMAPVMKRLYDEMADPKYVVAVGGCAIIWRSVQIELSCRSRHQRDRACGCYHPRLSSTSGGHPLWHDAIAEKSEGGEILRWCKPQREEAHRYNGCAC